MGFITIYRQCLCIGARMAAGARAEDEAEERRRMTTSCLLGAADFPRRFQHATPQDWDPGFNGQALAAARAYLERRKTVCDAGLLLTGPPGTGKTLLAVIVGRQLIVELRQEVRYITLSRFLSSLRRSYDGEGLATEDAVIGELTRASNLILDDIGAEKWSEWAESRLYEIIDQRYQDMRPTIVGTNLPMEALADQIGARSVDRLVETCAIVRLEGASYRQRRAIERDAGRG